MQNVTEEPGDNGTRAKIDIGCEVGERNHPEIESDKLLSCFQTPEGKKRIECLNYVDKFAPFY